MKPAGMTLPTVAIKSTLNCLEDCMDEEQQWLDNANQILQQDSLTEGDTFGWSAFHASHQRAQPPNPVICSLLPLFFDKAASPAMVKHGMTVVKSAISLVNPDQVPVMACDQPLFKIAKTVQWQWPDVLGNRSLLSC